MEAICEAMFSRMAHEGDATAPIMPWRAEEASTAGGTRRLRVGVLAGGDGFFSPAAAAKRTVEDVAAALRAQGHTVVEFDAKAARLDECALGYLEIMAAAGGMQAMRSGLFGEPLHNLYATLAMAASFPTWLRYWLIAPLLRLLGTPRMADIVWAARPKSVVELWVAAGMREERRKAFVRAMAEQGEEAAGGPLDVVVCPVYPVPAPPHGATREMSLASAAAYVFNYLHLPSGTLTVSRVLDTESGKGACGGEDGKDRLGTATAATLEGCAGLPVSVQVVGRPFEDETVLCAMRCVRDAAHASTGALKKRLTPPSMPLADIDVTGCL
jgi:Asp-tRNA(Asn)/Glu-tRNA(Gln) amidotransferase A subunit family amidase